MFWQPKNLYEYATPILVLWKFTGLPTFKLDTKTNKIIALQTSVLCCAAIFLLTSNFFVYVRFHGVENTMKNYLTVDEFVAIITQNLSFICAAYLRKGKITVLFTHIYLIEMRIRQLFSG